LSELSRFAHASEAELARILDYYAVRWEYEPRKFPILWNLDGTVVESFAPDFYLPELDTYVELTTLKQSLVRRKNRKLRRVRELYPDIRIKLFYGKDFKALLLKYGRFDMAASLSGLEGQASAGSSLVAVAAATAAATMTPDQPPAVEATKQPDDANTTTVAETAVASRHRVSRGSRRRRARRLRAAATASLNNSS
jgi:hypothetical protein